MDNMKIWSACKSVPADALKKIEAGRLKGKSDISPQWRLEKLTEMFGPCGVGWYYDVVEHWIDQPIPDGTVSAHVRIKLYHKVGDDWSMPVEGLGGSMLIAAEKSGLYHSDEAYKMATTDAISVACKQLGVASDVYRGWPFGRPGDKYLAFEKNLRNCSNLDDLYDAFKAAWADLEGNTEGRKYITQVKDELKETL